MGDSLSACSNAEEGAGKSIIEAPRSVSDLSTASTRSGSRSSSRPSTGRSGSKSPRSKSKSKPALKKDTALEKEQKVILGTKEASFVSSLEKFKAVMKKTLKSSRDAFDQLDMSSRDAVVSKEQWLRTLGVMVKIGGWDAETTAMLDEELLNCFKRMGNEGLTFDEFKEQLLKGFDESTCRHPVEFKAALKKSFANPLDAFDQLARGGESLISKDAFLEAVAEVGPTAGWDQDTMNLVEEEAFFLFDDIDRNRVGKVAYKDLTEHVSAKFKQEGAQSEVGRLGLFGY